MSLFLHAPRSPASSPASRASLLLQRGITHELAVLDLSHHPGDSQGHPAVSTPLWIPEECHLAGLQAGDHCCLSPTTSSISLAPVGHTGLNPRVPPPWGHNYHHKLLQEVTAEPTVSPLLALSRSHVLSVWMVTLSKCS